MPSRVHRAGFMPCTPSAPSIDSAQNVDYVNRLGLSPAKSAAYFGLANGGTYARIELFGFRSISELTPAQARDEIERVIIAEARNQGSGIVVMPDPFTTANRELINLQVTAAKLLRRRFLLAAFGIEPDGTARKARRIEIALLQHALEVQYSTQPIGGGLRFDRAGIRPRRRAVRHRFRDYSPDQIAFMVWRQPEQLCRGCPDVGVADRERIDKTAFEVRPDRRHEIQRVAAAKTAVHALALPQHGVGHFDGAIDRLVASRHIGTEVDHDGRRRRHRLA